MMLAELLQQNRHAGDRAAIVTPSRNVSWRQVAEIMDVYIEKLAQFRQQRIGLRFAPIPEGFAALAALDRLDCDVFLFDVDTSVEVCRQNAVKFRLSTLIQPPCPEMNRMETDIDCQPLEGSEPGSGGSSVTILTSGTSGEPKAVRHSWTQLVRPTRQSDEYSETRWFLAFRPTLYAGLQVIMQCFVNRGTLVISPMNADVNTLLRFMCSERAQYISATPSFWRRILLFADHDTLKGNEVRQITLGGEVVDQQILVMLHSLFPAARIVHIYATTELGRCFSVTDGRSGFPARYLDSMSTDGVELHITNGELYVRSANCMLGYDGHCTPANLDCDWFATGDLVEVVDDRVFFIGRHSDIINVGGNKVHPLEVERIIRKVAGVRDVRVFGKTSSVAGQLVACEIVVDASLDQQLIQEEIHQTCRDRLTAPQIPRIIHIVSEIELTQSGKKVRTKQ